jgi:8-oxo-dGTP diphosphatase
MQEIALTVDALVFSKAGISLQVLLIQRKNPPFQGKWALPGGFVENDEDLEDAAIRELLEETGIKLKSMIQVYAFGKPDRDPRQRVVTIAYLAVLKDRPKIKGASDANQAEWFDVDQLPELAFDHAEIINRALKML